MSTSFEELPDEVKLNIFSFFTKSELCKTISLVCKDWWTLSKDPYLWKKVTLDLTYDTYDNFDEDPMEEIEERVQKFVAGVKRCTMLELLCFTSFSNVFYLEVPWHLFLEIGPVPTLKTLFFYGLHITVNTLTQIKENYPFIQKLSFTNCYKYFSTNDFATGCAALLHLEEFIFLDSLNLDDACLEILSRCCPELKSLDIQKANFTDKGIIELAKNSNKTLQRVRLVCERNETLNDGFMYFGTCQKLISLELKGFDALSLNCLMALSELPILQTLLLRGLNYFHLERTAEEKDQMEKGFEIFFGNPFRAKLKYVEFRLLSVGESALINMSQTCSSLKELQLDSCFGITEFGLSEIFEKCCALDYVWLRDCEPLTANRKATRVNNVLTVIDS